MNDDSLKQGEEKVWHKRYARKILPASCIAFFIHILVHAYVFGSWGTSTVDSVADVGKYSSIDVGTSGAVYISYYDDTNEDLKYATNVSGSWVISTVDSVADVGKYSSIGVGTSGAVYIGYYDNTNGDLKYATNVSGSWVTSTVDSAADVGKYSSIGVGTSGAVYISYYDDTNEDLRYIVDPAPAATTGSVSGITTIAATLGGTVNANNGYATSTYYQYGATSGSYSGTSTTQSVSGSTDAAVNISISGLNAATNYYYRIVAQGNGVTTYGSEASFTTSSSGGGDGGGGEPVKDRLTINSASPSSGTTGISVNTTVSATFSMYVNGSMVTTDAFTVSSENGKAAGVISVNGATVTFTTLDTLDYNTTYTAIITTRVQAANWAGTTMESDYSWSFTTVSAPTTPTPSPSPATSPSITPEVTPKATPVTTSTLTPLLTVTATPTSTPIPGQSPLPTVSPEPLPSPSPIVKTRVNGYVYDAEGNPIDDISVNIVHNELSDSTETNSEGYYEFRVRGPRNCTLTYEKDGYETNTVTVTIVNEAELEVENITMESAIPAGMIYGYTVDSRSNDVGFVKLRFKGVNTKASETITSDADGFFVCSKIEPDMYEITATKKGYKKTDLKISVREGEENETEIVLKKKIKN